MSKNGRTQKDFTDLCKHCNTLRLTIRQGDSQNRVQDILPKGFCPLAFHSVYPYILTLNNRGWFNWVNYEEHVIVNCPHPQGVAMYVKGSYEEPSREVEIEVMKKSDACSLEYRVGDRFRFEGDDETMRKLAMLDNLVPYFNTEWSAAREFRCFFKGTPHRYTATMEVSA